MKLLKFVSKFSSCIQGHSLLDPCRLSLLDAWHMLSRFINYEKIKSIFPLLHTWYIRCTLSSFLLLDPQFYPMHIASALRLMQVDVEQQFKENYWQTGMHNIKPNKMILTFYISFQHTSSKILLTNVHTYTSRCKKSNTHTHKTTKPTIYSNTIHTHTHSTKQKFS